MGNKKDNNITLIPAGEIYSHPDNPRKDPGDLTELADSVGKKGIMQNLTVIPGHWGDAGEWHEDGYTLLIGHRRFAAAKMAGVEMLPCRIVHGMDKGEQVATMLEENMQRNDLTVLEQADGFQMMLDLGGTVDGIAEKTGFSKTTVRHRINIAKLDRKVLENAEGCFQLSIKDLCELEKVEDIATRNRILSQARDSRDIVWRAQSAAADEKREKRAAAIIGMLEAAGLKKAPKKAEHEMYTGKWETVKEYSLNPDGKEPEKPGIPKGEKTEGLYYMKYYSGIRIIKKAPPKKETPEEKARKEREGRKKQIKELMGEMDARKWEFIRNVISGKIEPVKGTEEVMGQIWEALMGMGVYVTASNMRKFFTGKHEYDCTGEEKAEADGKAAALCILHQMMVTLGFGLENVGDIFDYRLFHNGERCRKVRKGYAVLERYGWSFTGEEKRLLDGTHELYEKGPETG